ncbi:protein PFC0760c-like [Trichogramma pretiosum]|uniref:protein PFC0760c-like n=1 Tax=Trichogramma pretiosum TaxID=7493 RepID=UPI0006C9477C|nr:protein PFC0760c-like [Trichogramma pretiosum]
MDFKSEDMSSASSVDIEYTSDVKEELDELEDYFGYDSTEGEELPYDEYYDQYLSESSSDEDVEQVVIPKKKNRRKRSCNQDEEETSTSRKKKKKQKVSDHNASEYHRRVIEATLFEELAQEDEDEYENCHENFDENHDNNKDDESIFQVKIKKNDVESENLEDNCNGLNSNSLRFRDPNGKPWKSNEERDQFFDFVASKVEEDSSNENETDDESEDSESDTSDDNEILEGAKDILKFFELHEPGDENDGNNENNPAKMARFKGFCYDDDKNLSEEAKEDARKTRILMQSVYTVATVLHKFPLEYTQKEEKKVEIIKKKCLEMRAALIANGFPEDKLPATITK